MPRKGRDSRICRQKKKGSKDTKKNLIKIDTEMKSEKT